MGEEGGKKQVFQKRGGWRIGRGHDTLVPDLSVDAAITLDYLRHHVCERVRKKNCSCSEDRQQVWYVPYYILYM